MTQPLQLRYWPENACFGCGPQNPDGLHLHSFEAEDGSLVADWQAEPRWQGPPGVMNGGFLSIPMDCHSTWTAMLAFQRDRGLDAPPPTVTAEYHVRLRRPTPTDALVHLRGEAGEVDGRKVKVRTTAEVEGEVTAIFEGTFVCLAGD